MVTIRLDFESVAGRDEFLEHFADSEAAVVSEEPGVSVYRPSIDIADPTKIAIIERCVAWRHACWLEYKTGVSAAPRYPPTPRR